MPSGNLSYKFAHFPCSKLPGGFIKRPMIPVTLKYGNKEPIDVDMLLDSGSDFTTISSDLAEALEIDIDECEKGTATGVGGDTSIALAVINISFGQRGFEYNKIVPLQITLKGDANSLPLLGRQPLFEDFDVHFRMSYADPKGKFVLTKVTKKRDPKKFK